MSVCKKLLEEGTIGIAEAGRIAGVCPATATRWTTVGVMNRSVGHRIVLEHVRVGGKIRTSKEALYRFLESLQNTGENEPAAMPRTATQRRKASEAAEKELIAMGL